MEEYLSEKEQWDSVKAWVRENGLWIIAGIAVGAGILGGYRWYQDHTTQVGEQAGAKYNDVLKAFESGDRTQALVLLGELERDYASSPYVDQAKLTAARVYVDSGDLDKAATELQAVADHSKDSELALIAKLRLARIQISQKKADAAVATLNGLKPGAFAARYHEVLGDAYFAKNDKASALKEYFSAKGADLGGSPDSQELDLKIADLSSEGKQTGPSPVPPATAAAAK